MFRDKDDTGAQQGGCSWSSAPFSDHSAATAARRGELELGVSVRAHLDSSKNMNTFSVENLFSIIFLCAHF